MTAPVRALAPDRGLCASVRIGRPPNGPADFWAKIEPEPNSGCWLWTGAWTDSGHGRTRWQGKNSRAHRVAWLLTFGEIPTGFCVCHDCDNPPCVRPAHLFLGTSEDNRLDMIAKGRDRAPLGEAHGQCRLTDAQVAEVRRRLAAGGLHREIARAFSVSRPLISLISAGHRMETAQ